MGDSRLQELRSGCAERCDCALAFARGAMRARELWSALPGKVVMPEIHGLYSAVLRPGCATEGHGQDGRGATNGSIA